jgi:hypothetical protein
MKRGRFELHDKELALLPTLHNRTVLAFKQAA